VIICTNGPIAVKSKRQSSVLTSSVQAEYRAACDAVCDIVWLRQLHKELGHEQLRPTVVFEDNHGCISMTENNRTDPRTKHIDVKYHYTREQVAKKVVKFAPIRTAMMVADAPTKPTPVPKFKWCRAHMGIMDVSDQMIPTSVRGGVSRPHAKSAVTQGPIMESILRGPI
jgi:hypothetical protein